MTLTVPEPSLVILIGASGAGKSTFGHRHFRITEVISSDFCRALIADSESDMAATDDAFEILHHIVAKRLAAGRLTVVDATNVQARSRRPLLTLAEQHRCPPVAVVLDLPGALCLERNRTRTDRTIPEFVIRRQLAQLRASSDEFEREGYRYIYRLRSAEEVDAVAVARERQRPDRGAPC